MGTVFEKLPELLGLVATSIGIILSIVLIYTHIKRGCLERKKLNLEIAALQEKEDERREQSLNSPGRRKDDES